MPERGGSSNIKDGLQPTAASGEKGFDLKTQMWHLKRGGKQLHAQHTGLLQPQREAINLEGVTNGLITQIAPRGPLRALQ